MQEALRKMKEEEERLQREEEERLRQEELQEQARLEQVRLEQERKEKKKQKEKQRKERLKAEGKFMTTKKKQERARAQALIEARKAQGFELPDLGEKKPRPGILIDFLFKCDGYHYWSIILLNNRSRIISGTRIKPNKLKQQVSVEKIDEVKTESSESPTAQVQVEIVDEPQKEIKEKTEEDDVKDSWDAESTEDEHEEDEGIYLHAKICNII